MSVSRSLALAALAASLALAPTMATARQNPLPPINAPAPIGPKPPLGSGGCSITAPTCADVAPFIIRSALGPSPLERNFRDLSRLLGTRGDSLKTQQRILQWAVQAFQQASVDQVRVETHPLPSWALSPQSNRAESIPSANVVAEIRGWKYPNEFVVLGAPLGFQGSRTGSLADASNAAVIIEAARAVHAAGTLPLRSIRFVLFGETNGKSLGSLAYVLAHGKELDRTSAAIIYNAGDQPVTGYDVDGRKALETPLRKALSPAKQFHASHDSLMPTLAVDSFDFLLEGVPTIVTNHVARPADSVKFSLASLQQNVAVAALSAYGIADLPKPLATRQTRIQIEQMIERSGLENRMKSAGIWSEWTKGERGRRP